MRTDAGITRHVTVVDQIPMVSHRGPVRREAPTVVCVNGAGVSSRELYPLVAELSEHVNAWTVDLPGYGHSGKPRRPLTLRELSAALAGWLSAARVTPACLLGCSFGCQIVTHLAVSHPGLADRLVLSGPTVDPRSRTWPRLIARWLRNSVNEDPRMLPLNIADYVDAGPRRVMTAFRESIRDRIEDRLPDITVPTLVVRGELDKMGPPGWAKEVAHLLPDGRLVTVPGTPHMVPFRAPCDLAALVTRFVTGAEDVVG